MLFLITVFTPTYNRAYILPNLYKSLVAQSDKHFEWVVVDDGSSDNTESLINEWILEGKVRIHYKKQLNQGKHIAINTGVQMAKGELFFIVDSDDDLTPDAIGKVRDFWISKQPDSKISGIISYRQFHDGRLVGTSLPSDVTRCKLRDVGRLGSSGDKVVIYRTEIMKRFPYPKFEGERFFGESYVFNQIDDDFDMLVMDERVYNFDYQPDGLSQDFRKLYRENPKGFHFSLSESLRREVQLKNRISISVNVCCLSIRIGKYGNYLFSKYFINRLLLTPVGLYQYYKIFIKQASDVKPFIDSEDNN